VVRGFKGDEGRKARDRSKKEEQQDEGEINE
jgi:hypothetical protein